MVKSFRSVHLGCLQMWPCAVDLVSYPVDWDWIPFTVRTVSCPVLYAGRRVCMCTCLRVCRYVFVRVFILQRVSLCFWNFSLSFGSRFSVLWTGSNILSPTLSLLPFGDRHVIVWFTIEFGKNPPFDSHKLLFYFIWFYYFNFHLFSLHFTRLLLYSLLFFLSNQFIFIMGTRQCNVTEWGSFFSEFIAFLPSNPSDTPNRF